MIHILCVWVHFYLISHGENEIRESSSGEGEGEPVEMGEEGE